jgi:membrane-bound ClpP family serine protease
MAEFIDNIFNGTFSGGSTFLIIAILGLVVLVLSFLLDGIFEVFDFGDGPLSLTTIAAFATVFGFTGLIGLSLGLTVQMAALSGALAGFLGGVGAWLLSRSLKNSESTTAISVESLEGREASVIVSIPEDGYGEIAFSQHGIRQTLGARSKEPIATGEKVRILHALSAASVQVEPMEVTK